jgi:hypothetical protein
MSVACTNNIKLATPTKPYNEYKFITDEREKTSTTFLSSSDIDTIKDLIDVWPYNAGTYTYETEEMTALSDSSFAISPMLALDMHVADLFQFISHIPEDKVYLHRFIIRSKERFLGRGPLIDHGDCTIELTYMEIPYRVYEDTDIVSFDYDTDMSRLVNRCIKNIVGMIGDNINHQTLKQTK